MCRVARPEYSQGVLTPREESTPFEYSGRATLFCFASLRAANRRARVGPLENHRHRGDEEEVGPDVSAVRLGQLAKAVVLVEEAGGGRRDQQRGERYTADQQPAKRLILPVCRQRIRSDGKRQEQRHAVMFPRPLAEEQHAQDDKTEL